MAFDADQRLGASIDAQRARRSDSSAHQRERDVIAFAKVWAPYGGGSEADIFVTFGLTVEQYFTRLATLLGSSAAAGMSPAQHRTILQVCAQRLAYPEPDR